MSDVTIVEVFHMVNKKYTYYGLGSLKCMASRRDLKIDDSDEMMAVVTMHTGEVVCVTRNQIIERKKNGK